MRFYGDGNLVDDGRPTGLGLLRCIVGVAGSVQGRTQVIW